MATNIKLTALLTLPGDFNQVLEVSKIYTVTKPEIRITPIGLPMEVATSDHHYLGRIKVKELRITEASTDITFEVVMLFSEAVSKIYSDNYIA